MNVHDHGSLFSIVFFAIGLAYLFAGIRGLLGFDIVMPTKFSGLKRFTGRAARVGGGVVLLAAVLFFGFGYAVLKDAWR